MCGVRARAAEHRPQQRCELHPLTRPTSGAQGPAFHSACAFGRLSPHSVPTRVGARRVAQLPNLGSLGLPSAPRRRVLGDKQGPAARPRVAVGVQGAGTRGASPAGPRDPAGSPRAREVQGRGAARRGVTHGLWGARARELLNLRH